jgi:peptidoglycan/xylan/chitin deacetylase (PgdA/CDA1 family)
MNAMEIPRETGVKESNLWQSSETGWAQTAIANCYFHSAMPALLRRFREHYRLAVLPSGKWPWVSIERRKDASARILYYHRVNDDNDPFFPAISTALFEAQMRFVRQHYKVVSLSELLKGLAEKSTEPILAITFDDGYQDNYDNAFPILERYGLPATIFLTTGTIDSREPLWFEQLALAFKKSTRQFIDLDIHPSHRLWLRTPVERLESIDRAFACFRDLPSLEVPKWMARVLQQLAVEKDLDRQGKMLTWEQVRFMEKRGVDFGGHTVTHPFLSRVSGEQAIWEVSECKRRIEEELQLPVFHFAYPNGREKDFGNCKDVVRRAGYQAAVTTIWGPNHSSTDLMELRRGGPWEKNPAVFAYKLDWYQLVDG